MSRGSSCDRILCLRMRCCRGNSCVRPLRAACLMSAVVPLAALDQARVWRYQPIVPSTVSPCVAEVSMPVLAAMFIS